MTRCGHSASFSLSRWAYSIACSGECIEQFHEAHLVGITDGGLTIWLDPIGVLNPQVVMNLLPEFGVGMNLVRHGRLLGEANGFHKQPFI